MTQDRIRSGKKAEELAFLYLKRQGYSIVERNYKTGFGEIDIIGKDKDYISFIEVRSLNSQGFGLPEYTINSRKQNQITKAALSYIKKNRLEDCGCRFDVVCIEAVDSASPKIRLIKDAFDLNPRFSY